MGASAGDGSAFADGANNDDDGAQTCALFGGAGVDGAASATGGGRGAGARVFGCGQSVDARRLVAMHGGTFKLTDEPMAEPGAR